MALPEASQARRFDRCCSARSAAQKGAASPRAGWISVFVDQGISIHLDFARV
jgi:hypothetical protein